MPGAGLTATSLGSQQVRLTAADFLAGLNGKTVSGVRSVLARYRVPHQGLLRLYPNRPYGLYLMAFYAYPDFLTQPATPNTTYTLVLPTLPAQSTRVNASTKDVIVWVWNPSDASVPWAQAVVSSINYATGYIVVDIPISLQVAGATVMFGIYYLGATGGVSLSAQAPAGTDRVVRQIWSESIRAVHETNQATGKTALTLAGGHRESPYGLPEGWELLVEIASTDTYYWDTGPTTAVLPQAPVGPPIPPPVQYVYYQAELVKLVIHDRAALNVMADRHLAS